MLFLHLPGPNRSLADALSLGHALEFGVGNGLPS
jgi:hypothetical protein